MKPTNNTFEEIKVLMPWDHVCLGEFDKYLADLCSTVGGLVMKPFVKKLKELFLGSVIDSLSVRISCLLGKNILDDVGKDLND